MPIKAENLNIQFFSRMKRVPFPSSGETCVPDQQSKMIKEKTPGVKTYSTTDNSLDTLLCPQQYQAIEDLKSEHLWKENLLLSRLS